MPRPYFAILAVWLALAVALVANLYHYAHAAFAGVPPVVSHQPQEVRP